MELVVVDASPNDTPLRLAPEKIPTQYLDLSHEKNWSSMRAAAARAASSEIVAFAEDHALPRADWAQAILRSAEMALANGEPWSAAGYVFENANPGTYMSWASFITDYGEWAHPLPQRTLGRVPCNNVAYRRSDLLALGDSHDSLFGSDFVLCDHLRSRGLRTTVISDAIVFHQNPESFTLLMKANAAHCRVIASTRVEHGAWAWHRRFGYALAVPMAVPFQKLWRLAAVQLGRRTLWWRFLSSLPVAMAVFVWSSLFEAVGYLLGPGSATEDFLAVEVHAKRSDDFGETSSAA